MDREANLQELMELMEVLNLPKKKRIRLRIPREGFVKLVSGEPILFKTDFLEIEIWKEK